VSNTYVGQDPQLITLFMTDPQKVNRTGKFRICTRTYSCLIYLL